MRLWTIRNAQWSIATRAAGTRILLDRLLQETFGEEAPLPAGYGVQAKSHNAVAAAVSQERADWGIAIEPVASRLQPGRSARPRRAL